MNCGPENNPRVPATLESLNKLERLERWLIGPARRRRIDLAIGLGIVCAITFFSGHYYHTSIPHWAIGDTATEDIKSPTDLTIIKQAETDARRRAAAAEVKPIYDYDPGVDAAILANVKKGFAAARNILQSSVANHDTRSTDQVHAEIERASGWLLSESECQALFARRFSPELEELALKNLQTVLAGGVLSNRASLPESVVGGLTLRDISTRTETVIGDISNIRDVVTVRGWLRSGGVIWPSSYDQRERMYLGEWLGSFVLPNLTYNREETEARRVQASAVVPEAKLVVPKGELIVRRGQPVTESRFEQLNEARARYKFRDYALELLGAFLIVGALLLTLWRFLIRHRRGAQLEARPLFLMMALLLLATLAPAQLFNLVSITMSRAVRIAPFGSQIGYLYLMPVALGSALAVLLTDIELAFIFSALISVLIGLLTQNIFISIYTLMSSLAAAQYLKHVRTRGQILRGGFFLGLANILAVAALDLVGANMLRLNYVGFDLTAALMSGLLVAVLASSVLPLFEVGFKVTTEIKLIELGNLDMPLLRRLATEAPGTYHHCLLVGMLAEAAAEAIGADALFARVASYYHDIGKIKMPEYFSENFTYLADKHEAIAPKISSIVLTNHVREGLELARREKLPPRIRAVIAQHHGTALMAHFYNKAMQHQEARFAEAMENEFRYNGPKPQSREAAIIMIADAVEVASRALTEPTPARLRGLVCDIIRVFRDDDQFEQCQLTLADLHNVGESFQRVLTGLSHRITPPSKYPKAMGKAASGD